MNSFQKKLIDSNAKQLLSSDKKPFKDLDKLFENIEFELQEQLKLSKIVVNEESKDDILNILELYHEKLD